VALGVDYGIVLSAGSQEAAKLGTGGGTLRGLAVTGGVIAGASIVFAGTFAALARQKTVEVTGVGIAVALAERAWWPTRRGGRRRKRGDGP
jgi:uncharacterized membrane protein YdfJ with MMPL/SSD domain